MTARDIELPRHVVEGAADFVRRRTGLVFPEGRRAAFTAALANASRRAGAHDPNDYLARLGVQPPLLDDLVGEITVGETYFFREPRQFDLIRQEILPSLLRGRSPERPLRIWSAACATGEEPYTLAILLRELGLTSISRVVATDLSLRALAAARQARYSRWALRGVPEPVCRTYFRPAGDRFDLIPTIREGVDFRYLNLAEDSYPSLSSGVWGMDLILCRNVLIYFDAETVARVAGRLMDSLTEDGWLLLGASDPSLRDLVACEVSVTGSGLAYRRPRPGKRELPALRSPLMPPEPLAAPRPAPPAVPVMVGLPTAGDPSDVRHLYADRQYALAAEEAARLIRAAPGDLTLWVVLVRALANSGDLDAAGRASAAGLDRHSTAAELHYLHAVLLSESGGFAAAAAAARRALYLDREMVVAHLALGGALARVGDPGAARLAFQNAERLLAALPPEAQVPASDGALAGRLREMAGAQLRLLVEAAA